jgi:PAS domain S-box-containing protein
VLKQGITVTFSSAAPFPSGYVPDAVAIDRRFTAALSQLRSRTDRLLATLLVVQWFAMICVAMIISPKTWEGLTSSTHIHVWVAIFLGGAVCLYPAWLGWNRPGEPRTRHIMAIGQMLVSALLIHLTGGRIETHFHVFGSLALLALYRDARVFITATVVVYVDHLVRGIFWPESVYGVLTATVWRSLEHAGWVLFEVTFLVVAVRAGLNEMRELVARQIGLEKFNHDKVREVEDRTQELASSEEQFRSLFRDSPIGLYRLSPAGEFLMANPALLKILGFATLDDLRAAKTTMGAPVFDSGRRQFFNQLSESPDVLRRNTIWLRQDGSQLHIRESGRAFRDAADNFVHVDGTIEDITEHHQLEERFRQAQKVQAIGQLAGGIAHDFNNILTVISGYSQLLISKPGFSDEVRANLGHINDAGRRAADLTRQLLAFSRKQRLQPRVIYLNAIAAEMDPMLQRLVGENIRIRTIAVSGLAPVKADPSQIQQVVMNLVVNARDAMPNGGQLTIETANVTLREDYALAHHEVHPGPYVMLAVSDSGVGMTPEVQARLFEPFFTTKAPGYGTGLGLATCHGIVKQSGGHIAAYSEVGHGTTFKVYLPSVEAPSTLAAAEPTPRKQYGAGEHILLVEDDRTVREFGCGVLKALGYKVTSAANGLEALDNFRAHPHIDLLVTDVIMPNMGGRKLVENIRREAPSVPVLFTSGYTFDALGETEELESDCDFLTKPYGPDELGLKVHETLSAVRRQSRNGKDLVASSNC